MARLSSSEIALMREICARRHPEMIGLVRKIHDGTCTDEELQAMQDTVLLEFLERGVDDKCEATEYGKQVDELVGLLTPYIFWDKPQKGM